MPDIELQGVIVTQGPDNPLAVEASPHDGLYLQTDDGRLLELIRDSMAAQVSIDFMWRRSRHYFEPYLNKRVTVSGYLSRRTIYSANIRDPLPEPPAGPLPD
jgi:hypothetical protein